LSGKSHKKGRDQETLVRFQSYFLGLEDFDSELKPCICSSFFFQKEREEENFKDENQKKNFG